MIKTILLDLDGTLLPMDQDAFAPSFILASGSPAILPERSSIRTMSVGLDTISGAAVSDSKILKEPPHSIFDKFSSLLEFVTPIFSFLFESGIV